MQRTGTIYNDKVLANISLAFKNDSASYVADKLFPVNPVIKESADIATYAMDNLRIPKIYYRGKGSPAKEVTHSVSIGDHYLLKEIALSEIVPDEDVENAELPIKPREDATWNLTDRIMTIREKALADSVTSTSVLTQYSTLSGTDQWDDYDSSDNDPVSDIKTGITTIRGTTGKIANTMIVPYDVHQYLVDHPDIIDRIKGAQVSDFNTNQAKLASIFGVRNYYIASAQYNSADEGVTDSLTDIWSKDVVIAYVEPRPSLKSRTLGFTYQQTNKNRKVNRWYENARHGWMIEVQDKFDQKLIDANCGYLIQNAIS